MRKLRAGATLERIVDLIDEKILIKSQVRHSRMNGGILVDVN